MNIDPKNQKSIKIFKTDSFLKEEIIEDDKIIKYILNLIILGGALGFLSVGIASYLKQSNFLFFKTEQIVFFPQGLTMCFYGLTGTIIGINQIRIMLMRAGEGYNEFDKKEGTLKIYRKGFGGKDSDVNIIYKLEEIVRNKISNLVI